MIRLHPLDDQGLERLLALAVADADPADVMPPGWTTDRPDEFRDFYRGFRADAYEIRDGDRTLGMIRLTDQGQTGVWVARAARGNGVALAALRRLAEIAPGRAIGTITAETTPDNIAAQTVLRRAGAVLRTDGDKVHARLEIGIEPSPTIADPVELMVRYLDFYRHAVLRKLDGLSEEDLRTSRVPSGWTPLGLVKHLGYVELRWLRWSFAGEDIEHPRGNPAVERAEWVIEDHDTTESIRAFYLEQCERSRRIVANAALSDVAKNWKVQSYPRPTLAWILFHLLQEYARHVGQLDVVRELTDGVTGA